MPEQRADGQQSGLEAVLVRDDKGLFPDTDDRADGRGFAQGLHACGSVAVQPGGHRQLGAVVALYLHIYNGADKQLARIEHTRLDIGQGERGDCRAVFRDTRGVHIHHYRYRRAQSTHAFSALRSVQHCGSDNGRHVYALVRHLFAPYHYHAFGAEDALNIRHGIRHYGL